MAAIELDPAATEHGYVQPPNIPQLPQGYYFTLKDGFFHVHPDGIGGPYKDFAEANGAIARHRDSHAYEKEAREKGCMLTLILSGYDPYGINPFMLPSQLGPCKYSTKDTEPSIDYWKPKTRDPVVLEAISLFESFVSEEQDIKNGMKWMQEEATRAFEFYLSSLETKKKPKYVFEKLDYQCLISDSIPKSYHHYNFTMKMKTRSGKRWECSPFFAEVKSTGEGKHYFCCPLQTTDNGHCFGCSNAGIIALKHPANGGYEEGNVESGFPFDTYGGADEYE